MKTLYFLIGAPGAGKTTFLTEASQKIFGNDNLMHHVVSPDNIRMIVAAPYQNPDASWGTSQKNEKFVWDFIKDILEKKAHEGELIIVDATHSRNRAISEYKKFSDRGYRVVGVNFASGDGPNIEKVLAGNMSRVSHKQVNEDVVRAIHERCQNLEIPGWVEVITPDEFVGHFNDVILQVTDLESIVTIGDIHGCQNELISILDNHGIDPEQPNTKKGIVFVGDYFDRGYDPVQVFKTIQSLKKDFTVWTLLGNHEEPLIFYKEYLSQVTMDIQQRLIPDILEEMEWRENSEKNIDELQKILQKKLDRSTFNRYLRAFFSKGASELDIEFTQSILEKEKEEYNNTRRIEKKAIAVFEKFRGKSYKQFDQFIEDIKLFPEAFQAVTKFIKSNKVAPEIRKDPITGFQKLKNTSWDTCKAFLLSDIKYTEVSAFTKQCSQMFNVDFHGQRILVTHGGLVDVPSKATPTADMVRGVGGYEDALQCIKTFGSKNPEVIQVFGHRNEEKLGVSIDGIDNVFNVNGDVNLGLRAVEIHRDKTIETTEILPLPETVDFFRRMQIKRAQKFKAKKLTVEEEGQGLLRLFQDHEHVDVKKLPNNIAAVNFTKQAFYKGAWDDITVKARGLFVDINDSQEYTQENINILARGYYKFFNLGEKNGFDTREVRDLVYPIQAFEKANGYLGLLTVDNRNPSEAKWLFTSKTTTGGLFAGVFKDMIRPKLSQALMDKIITEKVTLVFEVIEPGFDPHIETYTKPELVLLDAIKNTLSFNKIGYQELDDYLDLFQEAPGANLRKKGLLKSCETFADYRLLVKEQNAHPLISDSGVEGIVFEDSSLPQNMFKLKTNWYSFWKRMRSLKIKITNIVWKDFERTGQSTLSKSRRISLKATLHTAEEFQLFEFMTQEAEKDIVAFKAMNIIEVRQKFIQAEKQTGKQAD